MNKAKGFLLAAGVVLATAFTLLIGCGEEKVVELGSLQQRGGVYVVPETQKPYSGKFVITKRNAVMTAGSLKKGKRYGETTTYRSDGSIDKVQTFAEDVLNGKSKYHGKNGKLMRVEYYKDGKKDGKWEYYDENEKLMRVEYYKDGKKDGKWEYYDENEKLIVAQQGSFADSRDKKTYKTVKIGTQTWMAENLNYEAEGSKCYDNNPSNCQKYGRLYNWNTAMKACPSGWHLPNGGEWQKLVGLAGGDKAAGTVLKAKSGWNEDGNGTDQFGFSALPGGGDYSGGSFNNAGYGGLWWSASENYGGRAYIRRMLFHYEFADWVNYDKSYLFSVRCLQTQEGKIEGKTLTDKRDGKKYKTVIIGTQTWMAENLNYEADGSKCYGEGGQVATAYDKDGEPTETKKLPDKEVQNNCAKYGRLYDWETAKAACPSGWHLPSDDEWGKLVGFIGGVKIAGKKLKSKSGWNENGNGTDQYGFSALPGGHRYSGGSFLGAGDHGSWWSASDIDSKSTHNRGMNYYSEGAHRYNSYKSSLYSVRCVQD